MKKNRLKILFRLVSTVLILTVGLVVHTFFGNPFSYLLACKTAENHLIITYPDTDYYIDHVNYSFKDGNYHAFVKSPSSIDTEFSLSITMLGKLRLDTYDSVLRGFNTAGRLTNEYYVLTNTVFDSPTFPYDCHIALGRLEIYPEEVFQEPTLDTPPYAINQNELILDKIYDISELGRQAGHLVIYIESDTISVEDAADIMLDIRQQFDDANVPFAAMDLTLQHPLPKDGPRPEETVSVSQFPYDKIYPDGMLERVMQADKELKELYAKLDAMEK